MSHIVKRATVAILIVVMLAAIGGMLLHRRGRVKAMPAEATAPDAKTEDPIARFKTEREQLRQKQRAELNEMIHHSATDEETLALAQRQLLTLMENENAEVTLQGLMAARGFEDALASVNGGAVYIMVRGETLTQRETAMILDLVLRETGVTAGNVKILAEG